MFSFIVPVVAIVYSLSIPIVAIIVYYFTRKDKMKVIEKAIEKGVALEGLSLSNDKKPRVPFRSGMVTSAVGLGTGIFAFFIGKTDADAFYPLLGIASVPAIIGIVLIINDKINYNRCFNQGPEKNATFSSIPGSKPITSF